MNTELTDKVLSLVLIVIAVAVFVAATSLIIGLCFIIKSMSYIIPLFTT